MKRRTFLTLSALGATGVVGSIFWPDEGLFNPCLRGIPQSISNHDLYKKIWENIQPDQVWDCHTHIVGVGDSNGEDNVWLDPNMSSAWHPSKFVRYKFYMDGACVRNDDVDRSYIEVLTHLHAEFPAGAKIMLLAFDYYYDENGKRVRTKSPFYISNQYANNIVKNHPDKFELIASIHPYREDAIEELDRVVKQGARAIKWLPPVMGIDPSSKKCDSFYEAVKKYNIPILTHTGEEEAVAGVELHHLSNPLLFRRPLEQGVRIIMAHSACAGKSVDTDMGKSAGQVENFSLFKRLMAEKQFESNLYGEISAVTQVNRMGVPLQELVIRDEWHHRLINGSDYPLTGVMPVYSLKKYLKQGYLTKSEAEFLHVLRRYNPLMFDFALKRLIKINNKQFSPVVFHSRRVFV